MSDIPNTPKKLLWVDLEMTGLNPRKQKIIEIAAIVTDFDLSELGRFERIVQQSARTFKRAEQWPKDNMQELFKESEMAGIPEKEVIEDFTVFIEQHFGQEKAILAGNSIHQDRRFIRAGWDDVEEKLHYRMFDVSTLKIWVEGQTGKTYQKKEAHRALDDILESIEELKWLLKELKK